MADDTATATPEAAEVETSEADQQEKPKPGGDVPPEVKAALRKANKEAETLRLKLQEIEDRDKTEAEKVAERAAAAEKAATAAEHRLSRLEVLLESVDDENVKRLLSMSKRLVGETREELEADAKELLSTFKPTDTKAPDVDLDLGTRTTAATSSDPRSADLAQIEADLKAAKRR